MSTRDETPPQRLPPRSADVCSACGSRVVFLVRSSRPSANPPFRIEYLRCPVCGAPATRLVESPATPQRRKIRYVYEP